MSKTLSIIQATAKFGRFIFNLVVTVCILLICVFLAGIIIAKNFPELHVKIVTFISFLSYLKKYSLYETYYLYLNGVIYCSAVAFLSGYTSHYFTKEIQTGHPFTSKLSKELFCIGIAQFVVPFLACISSLGVKTLLEKFSGEVYFYDVKFFAFIPLGIFYLVLSSVCKFGSEKIFMETNDFKEPEAM